MNLGNSDRSDFSSDYSSGQCGLNQSQCGLNIRGCRLNVTDRELNQKGRVLNQKGRVLNQKGRVMLRIPDAIRGFTSTHTRSILIGVIIALACTGIAQADVGPPEEYGEFEMDCPLPGTKFLVNDESLAWGIPDRALRQMPDVLYIDKSEVPEAGLGIFSNNFIPRYTWLAEYEGEILAPNFEDYISWYTWTVHKDGEVAYFLDGGNVETSSYLRFINSPNRQVDENVQVFECRGKVYYMTIKDLKPHSELLVFYGEDYLSAIGIDMDKYYKHKDKSNNVTKT